MPRFGLISTGVAALASAAMVVAAATVRANAAVDAAGARQEVATSVKLLAAGNYNAARWHAQAATRADPDWGLAHAVLARTFLALGDGVAAEGEPGLARSAGSTRRARIGMPYWRHGRQ